MPFFQNLQKLLNTINIPMMHFIWILKLKKISYNSSVGSLKKVKKPMCKETAYQAVRDERALCKCWHKGHFPLERKGKSLCRHWVSLWNPLVSLWSCRVWRGPNFVDRGVLVHICAKFRDRARKVHRSAEFLLHVSASSLRTRSKRASKGTPISNYLYKVEPSNFATFFTFAWSAN